MLDLETCFLLCIIVCFAVLKYKQEGLTSFVSLIWIITSYSLHSSCVLYSHFAQWMQRINRWRNQNYHGTWNACNAHNIFVHAWMNDVLFVFSPGVHWLVGEKDHIFANVAAPMGPWQHPCKPEARTHANPPASNPPIHVRRITLLLLLIRVWDGQPLNVRRSSEKALERTVRTGQRTLKKVISKKKQLFR